MAGILFWICIFLVIYVYAGYPFLVFLLSSLRGRRKYVTAPCPPVTLLMAAYNEEKLIEGKLLNSLSLDYPSDKLRIVVADDGSEDRTAEIVRSFQDRGVVLLSSPQRQGKGSALNRAMREITDEIVVLSDADNQYAEGALKELVVPFADPKVGAVTGRRVVQFGGSNERMGQAESVYWRYESFLKERDSRLGCCVAVSGEQLAIRGHLYVPIPEGLINDDLYIALQVIRQGYNIVYAPGARSLETAVAGPQDELIRKSRVVAGRYQIIGSSLRWLPYRRPLILWQIVSHKFLRPLVPLLMLLALVLNIVALLVPAMVSNAPWLTLQAPFGIILLALQALFYSLAVVGNRSRRPGLLGKALYLPTYLVMSNFAALQGLFRYASGRQTVMWKKAAR